MAKAGKQRWELRSRQIDKNLDRAYTSLVQARQALAQVRQTNPQVTGIARVQRTFDLARKCLGVAIALREEEAMEVLSWRRSEAEP